MEEAELDDLLASCGQVSSDWVRISPALLAIAQLDRLSYFVAQAQEDSSYWPDAIRALHLALLAALTEGLSGSMSIGALTEKKRREAMEKIHTRSLDVPDGPVMHLKDLLESAKQDVPWGDAIELSDFEDKAVEGLIRLRNSIDHPKNTLLSVSVPQFANVVAVVAPVVIKALRLAFHRYDQEQLERANIAATGAAASAGAILGKYRPDAPALNERC